MEHFDHFVLLSSTGVACSY